MEMDNSGKSVRRSKLLFGCLIITMTYSRLIMCQTSGNHSDAARLIQDKLTVYNKKLRPIQNLSKAVDVEVDFDLLSIKEFNEVLETISVVGFLRLRWKDEFMKWDPKEYDGINDIMFDADDIWTPDLVLVNPVDDIKKVENKWIKIYIEHDGVVSYNPGAVFSAICRMDTTFYPWDIQTCSFMFNAWGYSIREVQLKLVRNGIMQTFFTDNGEWKVIGSSSKHGHDERIIKFEIHLKRRSQFVLVNMILPIIFMSFLNVLAFLIPTASGERLSYCITVLLAQAVFLTIVGDNLPKTSEPMSILSYYLLAVLIISASITVSVILSLAVYFRDEKVPVPGYLVKLARGLSTGDGKKVQNPIETDFRANGGISVCFADIDDQEKADAQGHLTSQKVKEISSISEINRSYTHATRNSNTSNTSLQKNTNNSCVHYVHGEHGYCCSDCSSVYAHEHCVSWKDVSVAMDRILFVAFLLSTAGCMVWAMLRIVTNQ